MTLEEFQNALDNLNIPSQLAKRDHMQPKHKFDQITMEIVEAGQKGDWTQYGNVIEVDFDDNISFTLVSSAPGMETKSIVLNGKQLKEYKTEVTINSDKSKKLPPRIAEFRLPARILTEQKQKADNEFKAALGEKWDIQTGATPHNIALTRYKVEEFRTTAENAATEFVELLDTTLSNNGLRRLNND